MPKQSTPKPDKRTQGRPYYVGIALDAEEFEFILNITAKLGMNRAQYIRYLLHREKKNEALNDVGLGYFI